VSRTELDKVLDTLSGPDGLTAEASTFTRMNVVDALAKRLPVAPSGHQAFTQAEAAADRFLEERAVRVGHDRRLGVERFSTPELLALERHLVDGATGRAEQGCAVVPAELVRQVLDRHPSVGEDQQAMVRNLTQGGAGVAVVVGRAGSGKTWALGWPGRPSSWTATRSTVVRRPGSPPLAWPTRASPTHERSTGSCSTFSIAGSSWMSGRCW
jgi:hypothetical protein